MRGRQTATDRLLGSMLRIGGIADVALGSGLVIAPNAVLAAAGIRTRAESSLLRVLGGQAVSFGVTCLIAGASPRRLRRLVAVCGLARIASGLALFTGRREVAGGAMVFPALGAAELGLGLAHLALSRRRLG